MKFPVEPPETVHDLWLTVAPILDSLWRQFIELRDRIEALEKKL